MTTALLLSAALWAAPVDKPRLEDCARSATCWKLVRAAFAEVFSAMKTEAEGSGPGRFFPDVVVFSESPGPGHFLQMRKATRRGMGREVKAERDELERRLITAALLSALPKEEGSGELFEKQDWKPTAAGRQALKRLEAAKPGLWTIVDGWVWGRGPRAADLAPLDISGKAPR